MGARVRRHKIVWKWKIAIVISKMLLKVFFPISPRTIRSTPENLNQISLNTKQIRLSMDAICRVNLGLALHWDYWWFHRDLLTASPLRESIMIDSFLGPRKSDRRGHVGVFLSETLLMSRRIWKILRGWGGGEGGWGRGTPGIELPAWGIKCWQGKQTWSILYQRWLVIKSYGRRHRFTHKVSITAPILGLQV